MDNKTEQSEEAGRPSEEPNPEVAPASETWVEGQPESDKDYPE